MPPKDIDTGNNGIFDELMSNLKSYTLDYVSTSSSIETKLSSDNLHIFLVEAIKRLTDEEKINILYELLTSLMTTKELENSDTLVKMYGDRKRVIKDILGI